MTRHDHASVDKVGWRCWAAALQRSGLDNTLALDNTLGCVGAPDLSLLARSQNENESSEGYKHCRDHAWSDQR